MQILINNIILTHVLLNNKVQLSLFMETFVKEWEYNFYLKGQNDFALDPHMDQQ